jgi:Bacterial SH3 domain
MGLFLTKEMTMYEPDNTLIGVSNKFNWKPVVPDSVGDTLYNQICLPLPPTQFAEIITVKANLRSLPNPDAEVIRIAKKEDKFIVLPQTGTNGWYNIVDEKTQEDYWVHGNAIKIISSEKTTTLPNKKSIKLKRR